MDVSSGMMRVGGSAAVVDCWRHVELGVTFSVVPRSDAERAELRLVVEGAALQEQRERRVLVERLFDGLDATSVGGGVR